MKAIIKMLAIGICLCLMAATNVYAQEFDARSLSDMSKEELKAKVEDGNKAQTIAFQNAKGDVGAFDCNGFFFGVSGGFRGIDNAIRPYGSFSLAWEGIPTYRHGYKEMPDGRIVRDWRHAFSIELQFNIGMREYIPEADSEGQYLSYGGIAHLKWRVPGFDNWTYYRLAVNVTAGIGAIYGRYDKTVNNVYVWNNGFGVYAQSMLEVRFRFSKSLASAIFIRGGVQTLPGFALNEVWTSLRGIGEFGVQIPLHPNHRVVRVSEF